MGKGLKAKTKQKLKTAAGVELVVYSLEKLEALTGKSISRLPYSIRILVENLLRNIDNKKVKEEDVSKALDWDSKAAMRQEIPFMPARVVMQDFTGVMQCGKQVAIRRGLTHWSILPWWLTILCKLIFMAIKRLKRKT